MTEKTLHNDGVARVSELIGGRRAAMLTTLSLDGALAARPMALPERDFDGVLWFLTEASAGKVAEIEANPHVNVAFLDGTSLSLNGLASRVDDPAVRRDLWDDMMEQWFGCGPDDPSVTALRIDVLAAEYWETPGHPSVVIPLVREPVEEGRPRLTGDEDVPDSPLG